MGLPASTICPALVKTFVCIHVPLATDAVIYIQTEDHFWVPFTKEMDDKIDSFEVILSDPARAGQEWML